MILLLRWLALLFCVAAWTALIVLVL